MEGERKRMRVIISEGVGGGIVVVWLYVVILGWFEWEGRNGMGRCRGRG